MAESKTRQRDPIPDSFESIEAAAEFWDTHDLADYWDLTSGAEFEADIRKRSFLTSIKPDLAQKVAFYAHAQGISTETLINVWLTEKLIAATSSKTGGG
jgi:hypothetical protein